MKTLPVIPSLHGLLTGARRTRHAVPKIIMSITALVTFLILAAFTFLFIFLGPFQRSPTSSSSSLFSGGGAACDLTRGQWVRDPATRPYYTNATCAFIESYQNCMKHGRPSLEFLRWRWRPDGCTDELGRRFDAARFLRLLRGRSILFVGDSLSSSHVRSLVCTLSQLEGSPERSSSGGFERWRFPAYGLTVAFFWTPFQVRWRLTRGPPEAVGPDRQGEVFAGPSDLHLDEPDPRWASAARDHDVVVVSASHWFARPAVYYRRGRVAGCHNCGAAAAANATTPIKPEEAQRAAFRTVLRALAGMEGFKGTAILRTVAPTHYENGGWFDGGECTATEPADPEDPVAMAEPEGEFYRAQVEEFAEAEEAARRNGVRLRLMDVTKMMLRRPDGHPDRYGHGAGEHEGFDIDCLHWCLPGPIDVWNDLLFQIIASR